MPDKDKEKLGAPVTDPALLAQLNADDDSTEKSVADKVAESLTNKLPVDKKELVMAQLRHETGDPDLESNVSVSDNNVSGITWNSKFPKEWKGTARPDSEGGNYVHFPTVDDWATEHLKLLKKDTGAGAPIDADTVEDFAHRLKKNGYYTASEGVYAQGMKSMRDQYGEKLGAPVTDPALLAQLNADDDSQKKSPVASADGSANSSLLGQNGSSQNNVAPAPQGTQQDVLNNVFGKDISGTPLVSDQTQQAANIPTAQAQPEDVKAKTDNATKILADNVVQNAQNGAVPDYLDNLKNVPFSNPGSVVNDVSNPHGDPAMTGSYAKFGIEKLKLDKQHELDQLAKDGATNDPDYQNEVSAINSKYDGQINQLAGAAAHVTGLQLANQEYTTKKYTTEESQQKIHDLRDEYKKAMATATGAADATEAKYKYDQAKADVKRNTKYDAVQLGLQQQILLGNKSAEDDLAKYNQGQALDPAKKVVYQAAGLNILQSGAENASANDQQEPAEEMAKHSDDIPGRLRKDNKEYFNKIAGAKLASYVYNNIDNPIYRTLFSRGELTDDEIKKLGPEAGLSKDEIKNLRPEDVPTSASVPAEFAQSAFNSLLGQNDKDPYGTLFTGNVPQEEHQLNNWRGIAGEIAGGAGTVAGFVGQGALTGGALEGAGVLGNVAANAKRYETAANLIPLAVSNYNNAYDASKEIIGDKPKDEVKRHAYAVVSSVLSTALMSIDPATALGKDALGMTPAGNAVTKLISEGLENTTKDEFKTKFQQAIEQSLQAAKEGGKHTLTQAAIMGANKAADNVTDMMFDPEHRHGILDDVGQSAVQGGVSMLIPSLFAGAQSARSQTPANKALLWDIGNSPKEYRNQITDLYKQGKLTKPEATQALENITTASSIINTQIPRESVVNNKELSPEQKQSYAWNLLQEKQLNKQLDTLPEDEKTQRSLLNTKAKELDKERQDILTKAGDASKYGPIKLSPLEDNNSEQNPERSVAPDAQLAEETPATKKSSENVENSEKNNIPLTSDNSSQENVTKNENSNQEGRQSSTITNEGQESPNAKSAANSEGRNEQQEAGQLNATDEQSKEKAVPETEPPLSVPKKKKRVQEDDEDQPPVKAGIPIIHTPELQTRDDGVAKGQPEATTDPILKEAAINHPELPIDHALTDKAAGESQDDFTKRISGAMDAISKPESEGGAKDNAAIVTHSNVVKLLLAAYDKESGKFDFNKKDLNEDYTKQSTETGNEYDFKIKDADGNEKNLKVIRHGESESGAEGKQREDNDQLTPEGKQEAVEVAENMKENNELPSEIHTSTLPRAEETAKIIQEEIAKPEEVKEPNLEGFKPSKSNGVRKDGKKIFTKTDGDIKHEVVEKKDGTAYVTTTDKSEMSGVDEKSKTVPAKITDFNNLHDAIQHVNDYGKKTPEPTAQEIDAAEKLNQGENPARSVATEAKSAKQTPATKKPLSSDEQLKLEKTSLKNQVEEGKKAEKERIAALKSKDPDAIQSATQKVNAIKDIVLKKQEKISRLEEKQKEEEIKEKYNDTADIWDAYADKLEEKIKARKVKVFGEGVEVSSMGFPGISDELLPDFIRLASKAVKTLGNVHAAVYHAINEIKRLYPDEKETGSHDFMQDYADRLSHIIETPKVTTEPVLKLENEEEAKAVIDNINKGTPYQEAIKPIMDDEDWSAKTKGKILNYIDWHTGGQEEYNRDELRKPAAAKKYLSDYKLTSGEELSTYISGKTLTDVHGKEVQFDLEAKEKQLQENLVKDTANMVGLAKSHAGTEDVLKYGSEMLNSIKSMPDGQEGQSVKKLLAVSGLNNELHGERIRLENELTEKPSPARTNDINTRLRQIDKLTAQTEIMYRDITSNASNILNAARANRVFRNTYFHDLYADKILDEATRSKKEITEAALDNTDISDKEAEQGAMRTEKEAEGRQQELFEDKEKSEAAKQVESDITAKKKETSSSTEKKKSKGLVDRLKDKVRKKKIDVNDTRSEVIDKNTAEKKANEYLKGSTFKDLLDKAREQTKKPC